MGSAVSAALQEGSGYPGLYATMHPLSFNLPNWSPHPNCNQNLKLLKPESYSGHTQHSNRSP